jgi:hypothetical protein
MPHRSTADCATPPLLPGEVAESKMMQCRTCDAFVAMLVFAPAATDVGRFEDCARLMYPEYSRHRLPTWIIGPAFGPGSEDPADILQVWPVRKAPQRLTPRQFIPGSRPATADPRTGRARLTRQFERGREEAPPSSASAKCSVENAKGGRGGGFQAGPSSIFGARRTFFRSRSGRGTRVGAEIRPSTVANPISRQSNVSVSSILSVPLLWTKYL